MQGKFSGILLVSDVDGTLLTKEHILPKNNIDAINYFINNGGLFTIATGRPSQSIEVLLKDVHINIPGIVFNGGGIYDFNKKEYLWSIFLNNSAKEIVRLIIERFPQIGIVIYSGKTMFAPVENEQYYRLANAEKSASLVCDLEEIPFPWFKIVFIGEMKHLEKLSEFLKFCEIDEFDLVFSNYYLFEILPKGCSKGNALKLLPSKANINVNKIIALGDYYNDIELLKNADISAVVENAPEEIKNLAHIITVSNDKGAVADLIKFLDTKKMSF